jgi:DNA polymerase lambda
MYMGVCKVDGDKHFRRIDIKVYPREQYGFALLYFTGSGQFNRELREHALSMGMTLSDHGLSISKAARRASPIVKQRLVYLRP